MNLHSSSSYSYPFPELLRPFSLDTPLYRRACYASGRNKALLYLARVMCTSPSIATLNPEQILRLMQAYIAWAHVTNRRCLARRRRIIYPMLTERILGALYQAIRRHAIMA